MVAQLNSEIMFRRIQVLPLTGAIGAEIRGIDLTRPLDPETQDEVRAAFRDHLVIYFPDQKISNEQHVAFAETFGEDALDEVRGEELIGRCHESAAYRAAPRAAARPRAPVRAEYPCSEAFGA